MDHARVEGINFSSHEGVDFRYCSCMPTAWPWPISIYSNLLYLFLMQQCLRCNHIEEGACWPLAGWGTPASKCCSLHQESGQGWHRQLLKTHEGRRALTHQVSNQAHSSQANVRRRPYSGGVRWRRHRVSGIEEPERERERGRVIFKKIYRRPLGGRGSLGITRFANGMDGSNGTDLSRWWCGC